MTTIYIVATTIEMKGHASIYPFRTYICAETEGKATELAVDIIKDRKMYPPDEYDSFDDMMQDGVDLCSLVGTRLTDGDSDTISADVSIFKSKVVQ